MAAQLLLIEDVQDLGRSGDIVRVKPGFARNYLLPKGLGVFADKNALRIQARLQEERAKKAAQDKKEAEKFAKKVETVTIVATVKVDPDGHLYGSVSALDIANMLHEQHQFELDKRSVNLKHPIKKIGEHKVELKLSEGVMSSVTLKVVSEDDTGTEQPKEEVVSDTEKE